MRIDSDRHAARFGQTLQPRRDVDAVAIHRAVRLLDHIAQMHADAKTHAADIGHIGAGLSEFRLNSERRRYRSGSRLEHRQHRVPGHVDHSPLT